VVTNRITFSQVLRKKTLGSKSFLNLLRFAPDCLLRNTEVNYKTLSNKKAFAHSDVTTELKRNVFTSVMKRVF
jgi:hypothetical protein